MTRTLFLLILLGLSISIQAQYKLGKEIELGNPLMKCNEPAIAVNPKNTSYQLVATNVKHMFASKNGGKTYRHTLMKSRHGVYGDPVLLYDDQGNVYYVHLSEDKSKKWPESFDQIVIQKSKNNGKVWNDGIGVGKNGKMQDKPWISFEANKKSSFYGNLFLTWTEFDKYESKNPEDSTRILFAYSSDRGEHFSEPITINDRGGDCLDNDNTLEGATTCTGPSGEIFTLWAAHQYLHLDKSLDGGKTWGKDQKILFIPEGWNLEVPDIMRSNGLPFINSDSSGKLFACTAYESNTWNQVVVIESNDLGQTWTTPQVLQQDDSAHYIMPHAFLDKSSGIYAVIYYKIKNKMIDVLLSYKNSTSNAYTTIQLNKNTFPVPGKEIFFGDYINVCIVGKMLACTWTETKDGTTVVKTRSVFLR